MFVNTFKKNFCFFISYTNNFCNMNRVYSLINRTPSVFLPQWLVTILPATVSHTSSKSKCRPTNIFARSTNSLSAELCVIKQRVLS